MKTRSFAAIILSLWSVFCAAQGTIYESRDKAGPVFSDQPSAGARPIEVPPPNLMQGSPSPAASPAPAAAPYYSSFVIADPANGDSIHTNTGAFDMRVQPVPGLRTADGDRIRVKLDGTLLPTSYASATISLT